MKPRSEIGNTLTGDYFQLMYRLKGECERALDNPLESGQKAEDIWWYLVGLVRPNLGIINSYEHKDSTAEDVIESLLCAATVPPIGLEHPVIPDEAMAKKLEERYEALVRFFSQLAPRTDVRPYIDELRLDSMSDIAVKLNKPHDTPPLLLHSNG